MKLITETIEDVQVLTEEKNGKKDYKIKGVFMQADIKNRNGRIYPVETLAKEVRRYKIRRYGEEEKSVRSLSCFFVCGTISPWRGCCLLHPVDARPSVAVPLHFFNIPYPLELGLLLHTSSFFILPLPPRRRSRSFRSRRRGRLLTSNS